MWGASAKAGGAGEGPRPAAPPAQVAAAAAAAPVPPAAAGEDVGSGGWSGEFWLVSSFDEQAGPSLGQVSSVFFKKNKKTIAVVAHQKRTKNVTFLKMCAHPSNA